MTQTKVARLGAPALVLGVVCAGMARAEPAPQPKALSVEECVAMALRHNPDSISSEYEVKGAEAARGGARGQLGPKLHVDAAADLWDSAFVLPFGGQSLRVREPLTWSASITLSQPLTNLWQIYDQYKVQNLGVDVAAIRRQSTRRTIAFLVIQAYYTLLEETRLAAVADASVTELSAQEKQARSFYDNGVIAKNDLLRAGLALATSRQRAIQTRGQVILAETHLAQAMGVSPDQPLEAEAFVGSPPAPDELDVASAEAHALLRRLEVRELDRRIAQADASVGAATAKLVPQVSAVANYTHFDGSAFQQANAEYVGLLGSWDVWDWAATWSGVIAADAQLSQARIARGKLEDEIRVEARQAFVNADTAREALAVASAAVSEAEENYRIVTKKFDSSAATSFDVVDAEALLTQARGQVETALYEYLIARAALENATGAPLAGLP